ncbi:transposase [Salipaludibacillus aurantiacus]|uniref:Transposase n=1 Tax=Salipaludibacillus aurantiacus TaxID=1601833 RepID=A0A1H9XCE0_9BACI|nr:transposase [Salipaludibacillus aurantiacus]SES43547.1 Transposase [Salipaludibacillus aurantiacus]
MPNKRIDVIEDVKKKYVRLALESNKISTTAKSAGISRNTLSRWISMYEEEVRDEMDVEGVEVLKPQPSRQELEKKYEQAMKLLGEKELEVAMLREALKKNGPL